MINNMFGILKTFALLTPVLALAFRLKKVNYKREERAKQFFMPVVALIFVILAMVFVERLKNTVFNLIMFLPKMLHAFADIVPFMDNIASGLLNLLNSIDWQIYLAFFFFVAIMEAYILYKRALLKSVKRFLKDDYRIVNKLCSLFYELDSEKEAWFLKKDNFQMRDLFKIMYYVTIGLSLFITMVTKQLVEADILSDIYYPVYVIILMSEIYFYLAGYIKDEYKEEVTYEVDDATHLANFSLLRNALRPVFKDSVLGENTNHVSNITVDSSITKTLKDLIASEDQKLRSFGRFYENKIHNGFDIDSNYLSSSLRLLEGDSILFNNPFYHDLIPYAFYPLNRVLLSRRKVLVILGRNGIEEQAKSWLLKGIESVNKVPYFWNVDYIGDANKNTDISIVTKRDLSRALDSSLLIDNEDFLHSVEFVIILEPSKLLTTGQMGLNTIIKKCKEKDANKKITFCISDKNSDGLVDSLSHMLMTSITEVSPSGKLQGTVSHMLWNQDDEFAQHKIVSSVSRYLGFGTELSMVAIKNGISETKWFGGETFPVTDMHWIATQYYRPLLEFAELPADQKTMDDCFKTSIDYYGADIENENFFVVEDEYSNLFEILREFSTRSKKQGFVNVISGDYLLRDYMANNASIFETDPKAIPCIVPDYVKSDRNIILRLLLLMCIGTEVKENSAIEKKDIYVKEEAIAKELTILGYEIFDIRSQLWFEIYKCFAGVDKVLDIQTIKDYKEACKAVAKLPLYVENGEKITSEVILSDVEYDYNIEADVTYYYIKDKAFIDKFVKQIKSASYLAEDEKQDKNYLGSELACHIYQKYLPGQFFTLAGKYYEFRYLTSDNEIIIRRSADHINSRVVYRQMRDYNVTSIKDSTKVGDNIIIGGMTLARQFANFDVETKGYLKLNSYNDLKGAVKVLYDGENTQVPKRTYLNKAILRIDLPNAEKLSDDIVYTVTVLINEVLRTLFGDDSAYIQAILKRDSLYDIDPLTYTLTGDALKDNSIYIIEDSQIDLGLLEAFERNVERILEIVTDYLDWREEPYAEPYANAPGFVNIEPPVEKKKGFFKRTLEKIKNFFKKKDKKNDDQKAVVQTKQEQAEPVAEVKEDTIEPSTPVEETNEEPLETVSDTLEETAEEEILETEEMLADKETSTDVDLVEDEVKESLEIEDSPLEEVEEAIEAEDSLVEEDDLVKDQKGEE